MQINHFIIIYIYIFLFYLINIYIYISIFLKFLKILPKKINSNEGQVFALHLMHQDATKTTLGLCLK